MQPARMMRRITEPAKIAAVRSEMVSGIPLFLGPHRVLGRAMSTRKFLLPITNDLGAEFPGHNLKPCKVVRRGFPLGDPPTDGAVGNLEHPGRGALAPYVHTQDAQPGGKKFLVWGELVHPVSVS